MAMGDMGDGQWTRELLEDPEERNFWALGLWGFWFLMKGRTKSLR